MNNGVRFSFLGTLFSMRPVSFLGRLVTRELFFLLFLLFLIFF